MRHSDLDVSPMECVNGILIYVMSPAKYDLSDDRPFTRGPDMKAGYHNTVIAL